MEYYSASKMEIPPTCDNMCEPGGHYSRHRKILHNLT